MGPQLGNDLYQAMNTGHGGSSRGRGYSGSLYGVHQSNNTHHPSMLAMEAVDDDNDDDDDMVQDNAEDAYANKDYHMINPTQGQRDSMNSNERD